MAHAMMAKVLLDGVVQQAHDFWERLRFRLSAKVFGKRKRTRVKDGKLPKHIDVTLGLRG